MMDSFCLSGFINKPIKLRHLIILFLSFCAVFSFPAVPLDERSQEISWQAWLLVDDQNQNNKQQHTGEDGILRRRITPKSVFIAPTFSPDDLPPCADGYASDSMSRCVPIFKLDEDAHLHFLLNKLNDKFGPGGIDFEEEDEEEDIVVEEIFATAKKPTGTEPGPLKINIRDDYIGGEKGELEPEMTIIITPTSKTNPSGLKLDKREDDVTEEEELRNLLKRTSTISTTTRIVEDDTVTASTIQNTGDDLVSTTEKLDDVTDESIETTTNLEEEPSETEEININDDSTSTKVSDEDTTLVSTTTEATTTAPEFEESITTILPPKITTYHPKINVQEPLISTTTPFLIRFDDEFEDETPEPTSEKPVVGFVRFPSAPVIEILSSKGASKQNIHHTRDTQRQVLSFPSPQLPTTAGSDRILFPQDQPMSDQSDRVSFPSTQGDVDQMPAESGLLAVNLDDKKLRKLEDTILGSSSTTQRSLKKRKSREKNLLLPSRWESTSETEGLQKRPLMLRSVPAEHLSYLFGHNSQSIRR